MKLLLCLLFLFPLLSNAQFDLMVKLIDVKTNEPIGNGNVIIRHQGSDNDHFGSFVYDLNAPAFNDTLFIACPGYSFKHMPLKEHNYKMTAYTPKPTIIVKVYGIQNSMHYTMDLPIAKSSKSKIEDASLTAYFGNSDGLTSVQLKNKAGETLFKRDQNIDRKKLYQSVPYSELKGAYFEFVVNGYTITRPLYEGEWIQPFYIDLSPKPRKQEENLLTVYLESNQKHKVEIYKIERAKDITIDSLENKIEDLNEEIYVLKNGPRKDMHPFPPPIEMEPIEEEAIDIYEFVKQPAEPKMGMKNFLAQIKETVSKLSVKSSEYTILKFNVSKTGQVELKPELLIEAHMPIFNAIKELTKNTVWKPLIENGKKEDSNVLLLLNYYKAK